MRLGHAIGIRFANYRTHEACCSHGRELARRGGCCRGVGKSALGAPRPAFASLRRGRHSEAATTNAEAMGAAAASGEIWGSDYFAVLE